MIDIRFPSYNGLESQYEHVIYTYLDDILKEKGYYLRVKKTDFENIDKNIGRPDSFILDENNEQSLYAILELESTGKISNGITQLIGYAKKARMSYKSGYQTKHQKIILIGYDGQMIWIVKYSLSDGKIEPILTHSTDLMKGVQLDQQKVKEFLNKYFPNKGKLQTVEVISHKKLIKRMKEIMRGNKDLQAYRVLILTMLVSIRSLTKKNYWESSSSSTEEYKGAYDELKFLAENNASSKKYDAELIMKEFEMIKSRILYTEDTIVQDKVRELYEDIAIPLYDLFVQTHGDLYGFIYEELAEKHMKKEEGEYYTQRKTITPLMRSIYFKYLKEIWDIRGSDIENLEKLQDKVIADIFVGSGGFLYEFINLIKKEFNVDNDKDKKSTLAELGKNVVIGVDKNDPIAAYFNLFRAGVQGSKIKQVQTSINWQESWKYRVKDDSKIKIDSKNTRVDQIKSYLQTFYLLLGLLVDFPKWKVVFSIDVPKHVKGIEDFLNYISIQEDSDDENYNVLFELAENEYYDLNEDTVTRFLFNKFIKYSTNESLKYSFESFKRKLGNVDFLPTNVPYGSIDDVRFKNCYGSRLESVALKECIDFLKPSDSIIGRVDKNGNYELDPNGKEISLNNGGIGAVIVPNGIFERGEEKLINYLLDFCRIKAIIKLPYYTFSPYALVQTYFIVFQKKAPFQYGYNPDEDRKNVFLYIADHDGKANSEKRYETLNLTDQRVRIEDCRGNFLCETYEYLHDDFSTSPESYCEPLGYLSKIERSWIYGNTKGVNPNWNQVRITEKWDGLDWEKIRGRKWGYFDLEEVTEIKQEEKKSQLLSDYVSKALDENEDFDSLELEMQKQIVIDTIVESVVSGIDSIIVDGKKVSFSPSKVSNKSNLTKLIQKSIVKDFGINDNGKIELKNLESLLKSFIKIRFFKCIDAISEITWNSGVLNVISETNVEVEMMKKLVLQALNDLGYVSSSAIHYDVNDESGNQNLKVIKELLHKYVDVSLPAQLEKILIVLDSIDEIFIINDSVSLFSNIKTQKIMLLPDYYLVGHGDELSQEAIYNSLVRLLGLK